MYIRKHRKLLSLREHSSKKKPQIVLFMAARTCSQVNGSQGDFHAHLVLKEHKVGEAEKIILGWTLKM
jgi:hypothetical protein